LKWVATWETHQFENDKMTNPLHGADYGKIKLTGEEFIDDTERSEVNQLLKLMENYVGRALPPEIDTAFVKLAKRRQSMEPIRQYLILPLTRMARSWINPFNSAGWPVSLADRPPGQTMLETALANPGTVFIKGATAIYRALLPLTALFLVFSLRRCTPFWFRPLAWGTLSFAITKGFVLGEMGYSLARYTLVDAAMFEIVLALGLCYWFLAKAEQT